MKKVLETTRRFSSFGAFASAPMYPGAPRIAFAPDNEGGAGSSDDDGDGAGDDDVSGDDDNAGGSDEGDDDAGGDDAEKNKSKDTEKLLRDVMAKKAKLKDATAQIEALRAEIKKFEGIDADQARQLAKDKRDADLAAEEAKGNFERVKTMIIEEHKKETETLAAQVAELKGLLATKDGTINELTIGRSFSESKFISEKLVVPPSKARQLYGPHFEIVDGGVVGYDKPAGASERTVLTGGDGKALSFEAAMQKLIESDPDRERLIKAGVTAGAGSNTHKVKDDKTQEQPGSKELYGASRIAFALQKGK
jgi:hypothetical protein